MLQLPYEEFREIYLREILAPLDHETVVTELQRLPGIGPIIASALAAERSDHRLIESLRGMGHSGVSRIAVAA